MSDTTYDEARRCPKCKEPGKDVSTKKTQGTTLHTINCMNERCTWFGTSYIIQVNPDGTIPPPVTHRDKLYPALKPRTDEEIKKYYDSVLGQQLDGGGEVGRR